LTENSEIAEEAAVIAYEYVGGPLTVKIHEWFGSDGSAGTTDADITTRQTHHRAYEMERAHFSAAKIINE